MLRDDQIALHHADDEQPNSDTLIPLLRLALQQADCTLQDMDAIAFGQGPGSFTGVRIACSVAQGLAFGAAKPVIPVCTLLSLAEASGANKVITALDARMGEYYFAAYARDPCDDTLWRTIIAPSLCHPNAMPELPGHGWKGIGSGFDAGPFLAACYDGQLQEIILQAVPSAREIAHLAAIAWRRGEGVPAEQAAPLYLRNKVALTMAERAHTNNTLRGG